PRGGAARSTGKPPGNSRPGASFRNSLARRSSRLRQIGLDPPLPHSAPAANMLIGRIEREGEVERGDGRQREAPQRRYAIEPQRRLQRENHQRPGEKPERARNARAEQREKRRREERQPETGDRRDEQQRRVAELVV